MTFEEYYEDNRSQLRGVSFKDVIFLVRKNEYGRFFIFNPSCYNWELLPKDASKIRDIFLQLERAYHDLEDLELTYKKYLRGYYDSKMLYEKIQKAFEN